jgi:hypothetical protein
MTPEEKAARAAYNAAYSAAYRAAMTPEEKAARAAYNAAYYAARRASRTPEEKAKKNATAVARRASRTPEEKAARAAYDAAYYAARRASRTPEEKAKKNATAVARRASRTPEEKATIAAANREAVAACDAAKPFNEVLFARIKKKCQRTGRECTITASDIIVPEYCPVDGSKLDRFGGRFAANLPSPDRIDSSKGYVLGNVRVISWRMNNLKNDATLPEMEAVVADLRRINPATNPTHL